VITLRITSWKISEAEDIPKLRRLYRNKPACVLKVMMQRQNSVFQSNIFKRGHFTKSEKGDYIKGHVPPIYFAELRSLLGNIPKLRRLYRNKPACVLKVMMYLDEWTSSS
jgi:hypothetical protein